ncbi:MAG: NfeD family protein, partial [Beijerinckiaceae bacterium]
MTALTALDSAYIWLGIGLLMVALETVVTGIFLFWLGLAALATALLLFAIPLETLAQLVVFGAFGLVTVLLGRNIQRQQANEVTDSPHLNERGKALMGQIFMLESAIVDGAGQVRIGDSVWRVTGPELPV